MTVALTTALLLIGILIFLASLDDLILDILILLRLRGQRIKHADPSELVVRRKPKIKVFVANWQEDNVLEKMVEGNLENLDYGPVKFVLGVYPNDIETCRVAGKLARTLPRSVEVVVNSRSGPTSKGQMLNEMFLRQFENPETAPDLAVLHDSEDVISPLSFDVYASHADHYAIIQLPVFSLDARARSLVGATYMEEFAERHTREMIVRESLGAFIPSAGVGTCLRQDLILHFLNKRGYVLQPGSVTEDYILGAEAHREGFKTTFVAISTGDKTCVPKSLIATLEYFPQRFWASAKQRARWVYGICFDGTKRLGWSGSGWDRFFLYRDRKGMIANLLPFISLVLLILCLLIGTDTDQLSPWQRKLLWLVLAINTFSIGVRLYFKAAALREIYGYFDLFGLILRWPIATTINALATIRAWRNFVVEANWGSRSIAWSKTRHELPPAFGFIKTSGANALIELARASAIIRARRRVSGNRIIGIASAACSALALVLAGGYWFQQQIAWGAKYQFVDVLERFALLQPAPKMLAALGDNTRATSQGERTEIRQLVLAAIQRSADEDKEVLQRSASQQLSPIKASALGDNTTATSQNERTEIRQLVLAAIQRSADKDKEILQKFTSQRPARIETATLDDENTKALQDERALIRRQALAAIKRRANKDKEILQKFTSQRPARIETGALGDNNSKTLQDERADVLGQTLAAIEPIAEDERQSHTSSVSREAITTQNRLRKRSDGRQTRNRNRRYERAKSRSKARRRVRSAKRRRPSYVRPAGSTSFLRGPIRRGYRY